MSDLIAFLRARYDEEEARALAAAEAAGGKSWRATTEGIFPEDNPSQHPGPFLADAWGHIHSEYGDHIAHHDPARVLADLAAKRRILALIVCDAEGNPLYRDSGAEVWEDTLRLHALSYTDHPDYREEWRP